MRIRKSPHFHIVLLACIFALVINPGFAQASAQDNETLASNYPHVPNEILVGIQNLTEKEWAMACAAQTEAGRGVYDEALNVIRFKVPYGKVSEKIEALKRCHNFLFVEPNYYIQVADTFPNDPGWANQYGLVNIRAPQGWDVTTGSTAVTIAIIDSGVDLAHPDLATKLVPGYDFVNNDAVPQDDYGHGTHVAGIAAASSDNGTGIAGVSWGARIMPVKVLNSAGSGTYLDVAQGITWAVDNGAQVLNLSLGGSAPSTLLQNAVNYAHTQGATIVAASGNYGSGSVLYPARYPHVIAVGAVDGSNVLASFSNYGVEIDLVAPGVSVYSTIPGGYGNNSGTSMATPFVAGLAAILAGLPGNNDPVRIEQQMESSALDLGAPGQDIYFGAGLIQMDAAIELVIPPMPPPASLPTTGFSPERTTHLPRQPFSKEYSQTDLLLEIPALDLSLPIVGVPRTGDIWDVTWLGENVGWLHGSAFPSWAGNTVLTGHVWDADNTPGIFADLKRLSYGEQIFITAFGQTYTYEVRESRLVAANNIDTVFQQEAYDWLTLLTCERYNPVTDGYLFRRIIRAVLIDVR
ncbi:MAG: hypothetical protein Kow002_19810 [Anaerolineales bacterium]